MFRLPINLYLLANYLNSKEKIQQIMSGKAHAQKPELFTISTNNNSSYRAQRNNDYLKQKKKKQKEIHP